MTRSKSEQRSKDDGGRDGPNVDGDDPEAEKDATPTFSFSETTVTAAGQSPNEEAEPLADKLLLSAFAVAPGARIFQWGHRNGYKYCS